MNLINQFRYRPEIDGLRALAVAMVLLFHAGLGCPGGFVGVDVFFVISGFLITSLIWKDLESATFTFASFWERRARRIVPAMAVVTFATLVAGWFILLPADYSSLGKATIWQSLFAANFRAKATSDYFASASDEKPLLHMWSLAVEEQFYFIVPVLLVGLFRFNRLRSRKAILSMLVIGLVISFGISVHSLNKSPKAAFYLLPSRAWELLLGSILAFLPALPNVLNRTHWRELIGLAGLGLILGPVWFYHSSTPFPGLAALPPCLGTALIIWANGGTMTRLPTVLGKLLAVRPVVFLGAISYSLYLWHWPLLALAKYQYIGRVPLNTRLAIVCAALALATFTWKFVEQPFRKRSWGTSAKSMFAFAGSGIVVLLVCGSLCTSMDGFAQRFSPDQLRIADAATDMAFRNDITVDDIRSDKLVALGVASSTAPAVLVWGDSHAMAAMPAVDAFLKEKGLSGIAVTRSATPPILDCENLSGRGMGSHAPAMSAAVFDYIQRRNIRQVFLIAHWRGYYDRKTKYAGRDKVILKTIQKLLAIGVHPTIMLNVPSQPFPVPKVLAQHYQSRDYVDSACSKLSSMKAPKEFDLETINSFRSAGATVLDPKPLFLDSTGRYYIVEEDETVLYRDTHHLTASGALHMLLPFFRNSLRLDTNVAQQPVASAVK